MAIYTDATVIGGNHIIAQSSNLKSTISGHLFDALISEKTTVSGETKYTPIPCDNGVMVHLEIFSGDGLQERYAVIAGVKDKVGFVCSPPLVKDATTKAQESEANFYHKAGVLAKVYEVQGDPHDPDIFGVSMEGFTEASQTNVKVGAYVVLDGNGKYVAQAAKPTMSNYGFVGQIHSIQTGMFYTLVRIAAIQNVDNN